MGSQQVRTSFERSLKDNPNLLHYITLFILYFPSSVVVKICRFMNAATLLKEREIRRGERNEQ